ncbi:MAG: hypothetical protein F6J95_028265 [Leptolyngbya sp. SIO1E4]|nr:hypothetical protein [Leptolyngbya sp. SIO1E4]
MPVDTKTQAFYQAWAQRYGDSINREAGPRFMGDERKAVAETLHQALRRVSAEAWVKTEALIAKEVVRHQINADYIDPWSISQDVCQVYDLTLQQYAKGIQAERFAVDIARQIGRIRHGYTAQDPRVLGFVSMQFHYTGQLLLGCTPPHYQPDLERYFKAIDDHLYLPLQRAYTAAATYAYHALELKALRRLIPASSAIAYKVVTQVLTAFPHYHSWSGPLDSALVQASSVRDVEMFQAYLWVCVLEGNAIAVQQELFPLCVMLYPVLNVRWELVNYMLLLLEHELGRRLEPSQWKPFKSHLEALKGMFSATVFPNQYGFA